MKKQEKHYDYLMGGSLSKSEIDQIMSHYIHGDVLIGPFLMEGKDSVVTDIDRNEMINCQAQALVQGSGPSCGSSWPQLQS
ncbi:hypothetical protein [Paenibacillus sp. LjRoot56]|uniref:hypothetical protein n=1 Tax=Paenibacillus sp. LjRoot56 TaxID=3342333 RepID=UPI003ECC46EF